MLLLVDRMLHTLDVVGELRLPAAGCAWRAAVAWVLRRLPAVEVGAFGARVAVVQCSSLENAGVEPVGERVLKLPKKAESAVEPPTLVRDLLEKLKPA